MRRTSDKSSSRRPPRTLANGAAAYESGGQEFESLRARQYLDRNKRARKRIRLTAGLPHHSFRAGLHNLLAVGQARPEECLPL
jgi:hypothetical protein